MDRFDPEALSTFHSSVTISRQYDGHDEASSSTSQLDALPLYSSVTQTKPRSPPDNPKGKLFELAAQRWRKSGGVNNVRYEVERTGPPHLPIFQATVILVPLGAECKFTGAEASSKKEAEQLAAAAALPRMLAEM